VQFQFRLSPDDAGDNASAGRYSYFFTGEINSVSEPRDATLVRSSVSHNCNRIRLSVMFVIKDNYLASYALSTNYCKDISVYEIIPFVCNFFTTLSMDISFVSHLFAKYAKGKRIDKHGLVTRHD